MLHDNIALVQYIAVDSVSVETPEASRYFYCPTLFGKGGQSLDRKRESKAFNIYRTFSLNTKLPVDFH